MINPNVKLSIAEFIDPWKISGVISSKNFRDGEWQNECDSLNHPEENINKLILPINFDGFNLSVVTRVPAKTYISEHSHPEPLFRYVIDGDITINGVEYGPHDWCIIPSKMPYTIRTKNGYTTMARYGENCQECGHKT